MMRWLGRLVSASAFAVSGLRLRLSRSSVHKGAKLLLTRAGFAPNDAEVAAYASLSHAAAVDRLLAGVRTTAVTPRLPGLTSASLLRANCGR